MTRRDRRRPFGSPLVPLENTRYANVVFVAGLAATRSNPRVLTSWTMSWKFFLPAALPSNRWIALSGSPTSFAASRALGSRPASTNSTVTFAVRIACLSSNGVENAESIANGTVIASSEFTSVM